MTAAIVRIGGRGSFSPALLAIAAIPALLVFVPLAYAVMRSSEAGVVGIFDELRRPVTLQLLANTLTLMICVTAFSVILGLGAAFLTERSDIPFAGFWRVIASAPLAVPALVSSYAWSSMGPAFQTMPAAIMILTFACTPLIYLPAAAALRGIDPAFEETARSLGRGRMETFARVVLPQMAPAVMGGALLVSSHMLAEFGALSFLRVETFTTEIFLQYDAQFDNATAALLSSVLMAIAMPLALVEMRVRQGRRFARSGKGVARQPQIGALGLWGIPAILGFLAFAGLALGVPFWMLAYWLANGASIGLGLERVLPALLGSLSYSLSGGVLTTLLAIPLVLASMRLRGWVVILAERLPYAIHGLPGLVIALALIFFAIRFTPALYQTPLLVLIAYVMLFLPLAQSAIRASAELIPPELEDVARTLGKSPLVAFIEVTLPSLLPGVGAALALVILQLMRELTATLLLAPSGVVTLATEFWSYTNDRAYAAAAPFALALVVASGVPVYVFTLRTLRRGA